MSFSRKNWSALSSLAQQRSVEDEEEQERERRRRHRQLSSSSDAKQETSSTEEKVTSQVPNRFRNSSEAKPSKLGNSILENDRKLVEKLNKPDNRRTRWKAGNLNNVKQDEKETVNARKLEGDEEKVESLSEPVQEQKDSKPDKCLDLSPQRNATEGKKLNLHVIKDSKPDKCPDLSPQKNTTEGKNLNLHVIKDSKPDKCPDLSPQKNTTEGKNLNLRLIKDSKPDKCLDLSPQRNTTEGKNLNLHVIKDSKPDKCPDLSPQRNTTEGKNLNLRLIKDSKPDKCPDLSPQRNTTERKNLNLRVIKREPIVEKHDNLKQEENPPKPSKDEQFDKEEKIQDTNESQRAYAIQDEVTVQTPQRAAWERKSISRLEVKINSRIRNSTEASSPPAAIGVQATERSIPETEEADHQDGAEVFSLVSQPSVSYSSSFRRISPRTISFRVVSPRDKQDTLSRSASMRLPASTGKFEEKLEKYTSAVQRVGSMRLPPSARRNFQPPAEGVASKRNIFEANVATRAEPIMTVRKESLTIPGGVSSRINLWVSRSQEPSKDEGIKDTRTSENSQRKKGPSDS